MRERIGTVYQGLGHAGVLVMVNVNLTGTLLTLGTISTRLTGSGLSVSVSSPAKARDIASSSPITTQLENATTSHRSQDLREMREGILPALEIVMKEW